MTAPRTVDIELDGVGSGRIVVDGTELAAGVSAVEVDAEAGDRPTVTLRLKVTKRARFEGLADVTVDADTAAVLRLLGWAPPPADRHDGDVAPVVGVAEGESLAYHLVRRAVTEIIAGDHR